MATPPNGYGQIRFVFALIGKPDTMVSTIGYHRAVGDFADPSAAAETYAAAFSAASRPFSADAMITAYTFQGCEATEYSGGAPFVGSASRNLGGTNGGTALPPNCSFLVTKRSTAGGRRGRGRMFLPPIMMGETLVNEAGAVQDSTNLEIYQGYWDDALAAVQASDFPPVLLHTDGSTPSPITALTIQRLIATQRRRLR